MNQEQVEVSNGSLIDRISKNEADFLLGFYIFNASGTKESSELHVSFKCF